MVRVKCVQLYGKYCIKNIANNTISITPCSLCCNNRGDGSNGNHGSNRINRSHGNYGSNGNHGSDTIAPMIPIIPIILTALTAPIILIFLIIPVILRVPRSSFHIPHSTFQIIFVLLQNTYLYYRVYTIKHCARRQDIQTQQYTRTQ